MSVEEKIFSAITASTAITAVTSTRIYPLAIPQGVAAFPALVYSRAGSLRVHSLSGYSGLENAQIEVTCWATRYDDAKGLAASVHTAMQNATSFQSLLTDDADGIEPDAGLYSITLNFSVWHRD